MSERGADEQITRRDLLSQQFDAVEEEANTAPAEETSQPGRERDETGKFVAKSAEPKEEKPEPVAKAAFEPTTEEVPIEPPVWARPPASWKKPTDLATWQAMTPAAQQRAFEREEQMRTGVESAIPKARLADEITKVSEPYMNTIRGLGIDLPRAVEGLLKVDHTLRYGSPEQKRAEFGRLAQIYGVNIEQQAPLPGGQQTTPTDPNYHALANQFNSLRGEVLSFKQAQEQAQQSSFLTQINEFAKTADHFEEVRPTMVKLIESGFATTLSDAYTKAIKLNDELSERIAAETSAAAEAVKRETANRAAKAAKAAAVSVKTSTPGRQTTTNAQTRREKIVELVDGLDARL